MESGRSKKCIRAVVITLGFVLFPYLYGQAEEQSSKLPEDGWWIRYCYTDKQEANGQVHEFTQKITYSLVGTVMEDGEKCRWVELKIHTTLRGEEDVVFRKFLVAEKELIENEQPLDKLKRAWGKSSKRGLRELKLGQDVTSDSRYLRIFPGEWQKSERVDQERIVDYQKGRLSMPQARKRNVTMPINVINAGGSQKTVNWTSIIETTVWFDQVTSPVIAAERIQTKEYEKEKLILSREENFVIEDIGSDAKSSLPEIN